MSQESLKTALLATIEAIKAKPDVGKVVFRSETKWISDTKCEAKVRDFDVMTIDEPPELGGGNAGPNRWSCFWPPWAPARKSCTQPMPRSWGSRLPS